MTRLLLPRGYRNAELLHNRLGKEPEELWQRRGQQRALQLFHEMAQRVPAYKDFLKSHNFNPALVKDLQSFQTIPTIDKDNYLRKYPREALCWDGEFKNSSWVISSTSGSTGAPYYFPRQDEQDEQYAITAELYLRSNFQIHNRSTLYINAFAMGVWIGGVFTYEAIRRVAQKGYRLSIITPGINKEEVVKAVQNLGKDFDQIIIGSYPPILKDILDDGVRAGVNWHDYKLGFVLSAEGFSETFRDYLIEVGGLRSPYLDTLNHYGTVDLGTMSHETPVAILLRRLLVENPRLYEAVFGQLTKLPTLTQFMPEMFYFEDQDGKLLCSAVSGLPLVRYDLKDNGGVITLKDMQGKLKQNGVDLEQEICNAGLESTLWNLPFVYVYERSDMSVSFLGFQIYPEPVRKALQQEALRHDLTGKFSMVVEYDEENEQRLMIHLELKAAVKSSPELVKKAQEMVIRALVKDNPIYKMNYETIGQRAAPIMVLWPYEDPTHFRVGGKQKWVKK